MKKQLFINCLAIGMVAWLGTNTQAQTISQTFTTTTIGWVVPANVYQIYVEAWGAGGGGAPTDGPFVAPGGGGGGAYAKSLIAVTPGQAMDIEVGVGGTGGQPTASDGGNSWVIDPSVFLAEGGKAGDHGPTYGLLSSPGPGGDGGSGGSALASLGNIAVYSGGDGAQGFWSLAGGYGGGGGSVAGDAAAGVSATDRLGANGPLSPDGDGGDGATYGNNGDPGIFPGGGGGAGRGFQPLIPPGPAETRDGGDGADGLVIITYTPTDPMAVPISSWALFIGIGLIATFMFVRFRNMA